MFNLEQAITEWRKQRLTAGIQSPLPLEELESHLREDVEQQMRSGLSAEIAFEIAVQRIGQAESLKSEFAKVSNVKETRLQKLKLALLDLLGLRQPLPVPLAANAQKSLELGGKEALGFYHDFIGTEHVLLGLLESQTDIVTSILRRMGVDSKAVRSEIQKVVGVGIPQQTAPDLPFTPRVKKALEMAGREARTHSYPSIGVEHIFLGLLLEGSGVAALVLKNLGVNVETARQEIAKNSIDPDE